MNPFLHAHVPCSFLQQGRLSAKHILCHTQNSSGWYWSGERAISWYHIYPRSTRPK